MSQILHEYPSAMQIMNHTTNTYQMIQKIEIYIMLRNTSQQHAFVT